MSFTNEGYNVETLTEIMGRIYASFIDVLPDLEFTPDNIITHWQEIVAYEQRLNQIMLSEAIDNFSILSSQGIYLDRNGIEAGVIRKGATYSTGDIVLLGIAEEGGTVSTDEMFSTSTDITFYTTDTASFTQVVPITRSDLMVDDIPYPYSGAEITGLYYDSTLTGIISGTWYTYADDVITWNQYGLTGLGFVIEGNEFYAKATGLIYISVPVISEEVGSYYNIGADKITVNRGSNPNVLAITNPDPFYNGTDVEDNEAYRYRVLKARRKTFSLGRLESLTENIYGVRDATVYQVTNTDRNSLASGLDGGSRPWDINNLSGFTGTATRLKLSGEYFGFSWYPSNDIATLKEIKLYGRITGVTAEAPPLSVWLKPHYSGAWITDTGYYDAYSIVDKEILERDNYTGWQEITVPLVYNGTDNAKTYRVYMHQEEASGAWEFCYSGAGDIGDYRQEFFTGKVDVIGNVEGRMLYRTMYGSPSFNVDVVVEDGYRFDPEIKDKVDDLINYDTGDGCGPVCIAYNIRRAKKVYMGLRAYVYAEDNYTWDEIISNVKVAVGLYLRSIKSGSNIVYSKVDQAISNSNGVRKNVRTEININDGDWVDRTTQSDLKINEKEYADLDTAGLYEGVILYRG